MYILCTNYYVIEIQIFGFFCEIQNWLDFAGIAYGVHIDTFLVGLCAEMVINMLKINMKYLLNRKLFELFELFDKKVRNYSLFDKFLNPYLKPSLVSTIALAEI
jgi:hypothetical protein